MRDNIEITDGLIACYVDNQVSESEREVVNLYLADNPDELESVMVMTTSMLLNEDAESLPEDFLQDCSAPNLDSDIVYSAAAFAPQKFHKATENFEIKSNSGESIFGRLANMLSEIEDK